MDEQSTTLVVLAGGYGSRIGRPKSLLQIDGQPILQRLVNRLLWTGPTMIVTAPGMEQPPGHQMFDCEVCDPVVGEGPLRGIVTALETGVPSAIIVPVDMPMLTGNALRWIATRPADCGVFLRRDGRIESMPVLLTGLALPIARERLGAGRRSVHGLAEERGFSVVTTPVDWPDDFWLNVNAPADLAKLEAVPMAMRSDS